MTRTATHMEYRWCVRASRPDGRTTLYSSPQIKKEARLTAQRIIASHPEYVSVRVVDLYEELPDDNDYVRPLEVRVATDDLSTRDRLGRFAIYHSYTREFLSAVFAVNERDALDRYAQAEGFSGYTGTEMEDAIYVLEDGTVGAPFLNYEIHAVRVD